MSQAFKCDRCSKLYEANIITLENEEKYRVLVRTRELDRTFNKIDLCGDCQSKLEQFLFGQKEGASTDDGSCQSIVSAES